MYVCNSGNRYLKMNSKSGCRHNKKVIVYFELTGAWKVVHYNGRAEKNPTSYKTSIYCISMLLPRADFPVDKKHLHFLDHVLQLFEDLTVYKYKLPRTLVQTSAIFCKYKFVIITKLL